MAAQLISDMTTPWQSADYSDTFSNAIRALVAQKVAAGETATVPPLEDTPTNAAASNVVDLTALLAQSLAKRKPAARGGAPGAKAQADAAGTADATVAEGAAKKAPAQRAVRKRA